MPSVGEITLCEDLEPCKMAPRHLQKGKTSMDMLIGPGGTSKMESNWWKRTRCEEDILQLIFYLAKMSVPTLLRSAGAFRSGTKFAAFCNQYRQEIQLIDSGPVNNGESCNRFFVCSRCEFVGSPSLARRRLAQLPSSIESEFGF